MMQCYWDVIVVIELGVMIEKINDAKALNELTQLSF